jgi:hypothetical protein
MKFVTLILVLALGVYAVIFHYFPELRDAVRTAQLTGPNAERYRIYATGKAYLRANWPEAAGAEFGAWGDNPAEGAIHGNDATDLAMGHVTFAVGSVKVRRSWCAAVNRASGDPIDFAVGDDADQAIKAVAAGTFQTAKKRSLPAHSQIGSWNSLGSPLDKKAR